MNTKYIAYTAEDFANDPAFWVWVLEEDAEVSAFWDSFLKEYPEKRGEIEAAKRIVLEMNDEEQEPYPKQVDQLWNRIQVSKALQKENGGDLRREGRKSAKWVQAATIFLGFISLSLVLYFVGLHGKHTEVANRDQNKKEVVLPDGSLIVLKNGSQIRYGTTWDSLQIREVWLEGEAFFEVAHKHNNQKFMVHSEGLDIEVVGTSFNVNSRSAKTQVVLNSGKIRLHLNRSEKYGKRIIEMMPGDMVEYKAQQAEIVVRQVNPQKFIAWKTDQMVFEEETLGEIFQQLQASHGIRVVVVDSSILDRKFTATIPSDQLSILLEGLAEAHQLEITKSENVLYVSPRR